MINLPRCSATFRWDASKVKLRPGGVGQWRGYQRAVKLGCPETTDVNSFCSCEFALLPADISIPDRVFILVVSLMILDDSSLFFIRLSYHSGFFTPSWDAGEMRGMGGDGVTVPGPLV